MCGIFGIVKDMTAESDPNIINLLKTPGKEAIFSNVLITPEGEARWTNDGRPIPEEGINFQGNWTKSMLPDTPISHGNARVTLNSEDIANFAIRSIDKVSLRNQYHQPTTNSLDPLSTPFQTR